jgi:hypothetical protein
MVNVSLSVMNNPRKSIAGDTQDRTNVSFQSGPVQLDFSHKIFDK